MALRAIRRDDAQAWRDDLTVALGVPATAPPFAASALPLVAALPADDPGAGLLALAVAAESRSPALNLLPAAARPWAPSRGQLVTAAMVAVVALLGLSVALVHVVRTGAIPRTRHRGDPPARARGEGGRRAGRGARAEAARARPRSGPPRRAAFRPCPVLRELTETLPAGAWLQALTMDRQGVELTGQADGASALIPLLEASSRLERVEFTSPVTKTQGKEQFRIRAAWEKAPQPRPRLSPERRGSR